MEVVDFGATRCGFSQKSPNLDYFSVIFCVFEQFLEKPHLVARQNVTFWRFGKNMSGSDYKCLELFSDAFRVLHFEKSSNMSKIWQKMKKRLVQLAFKTFLHGNVGTRNPGIHSIRH